jgi:hypothetical protein
MFGVTAGVTTYAGVILLTITGILSILGLISRIKNKHFDGLYLLFYILMLLLWPFSPEAKRYLYPVFSVMILHAVYMVYLGGKYLKFGSSPIVLFIVAILIYNMPALAMTYTRYTEDLPDDYIAYRHTATWYRNERQAGLRRIAIKKTIIEAMHAVKQAVPEDQCVYSIKPSIVGMYSDRMSIQTPLEKLSDQDFMNEVTEKGCQFFFVLPFSSISYRTPLYPAKRIKGLAEQVFIVKKDSAIYAVLYKLYNKIKQPKADTDSSSIM